VRIIAGEYSSRRIEAPRGMNTRPTLDQVREAVFSSLGGMFEGGSFLDLYAGSGANGLEAVSRGFSHSTFVDSSREAVTVIKKNIQTLKCNDFCTVLCMKDSAALKKLSEEKFDCIYMDPPYAKQKNAEILAFLSDHEMVKPGGRVVIESAKEDEFKEDYEHLYYEKDKVYGIVRITYYRGR